MNPDIRCIEYKRRIQPAGYSVSAAAAKAKIQSDELISNIRRFLCDVEKDVNKNYRDGRGPKDQEGDLVKESIRKKFAKYHATVITTLKDNLFNISEAQFDTIMEMDNGFQSKERARRLPCGPIHSEKGFHIKVPSSTGNPNHLLRCGVHVVKPNDRSNVIVCGAMVRERNFQNHIKTKHFN